MLLPGVIETAARRFEVEGHSARLLLMALIVGAEAAGLEDWLANLPALYREQNAATRLAPAPFIESLLAHIAALPAARRRAVWQQAGRPSRRCQAGPGSARCWASGKASNSSLRSQSRNVA